MSDSAVVLAYWAPLYLTVDVESRQVVAARVISSGLRSGGRVSGQSRHGGEREAARIVDEAVAKGDLPDIEVT